MRSLIAYIKNKPYLWAVLFFLLIFCLPSFFEFMAFKAKGRYQLGVLNDIGIYALLALSLNLILGKTGLFNMGHTAFFAIGAYTTAILNTVYQIPIALTLPLAGICAAFFAFLVTLPILRLSGDYLLVVTIGLVEIVRITINNNILGLTGGANGIAGIGRFELFSFKVLSPQDFFYFIWGFVALSYLVFTRLENSRFGRALNYIRYDEVAANGCGVNVYRYKLIAFVVGAFWAGLAGTLYASKMKFVSPEAFSFSESVLLFAMVILGGAGNLAGAILGAAIIIGLPEVFRGLSDYRMLVFGAAMVAMMIFRPQGFLRPKRHNYKVDDILQTLQTSSGSKQTRGEHE